MGPGAHPGSPSEGEIIESIAEALIRTIDHGDRAMSGVSQFSAGMAEGTAVKGYVLAGVLAAVLSPVASHIGATHHSIVGPGDQRFRQRVDLTSH